MAANTEVNVKINVDAKGADTSVGSVKKQLREASAELINMRQKFGDSSAEAANAAKKVAELKDAIGDAKNMVDAFDPDAKFNAFGAALQGVAGGFAAVQGAQALFGAESENVAKVLAKVQGAMALSQGINSVLQARDSFKNLNAVLQNNVIIQKALSFVMTGSFQTQKAVTQAKQADVATTVAQTTATTGLTVAQNIARIAAMALRGALMATGIGAIIIGIIALINKIVEWTGASDEAAKKQQEFAEKQSKNNESIIESNIKRLRNAEELALKEAEIAGKGHKELEKIREDAARAEIAQLEDRNNYIRKHWETATQEDANALNSNKDRQQELFHEINKIHQESRSKDLQIERDYNNQLSGLQTNNYLNSIKDENQRAKEKARIDYENNVKKLSDTEFTESQRTELEKQYAIQRDQEVAKVDEAAYKKQQEKATQNANIIAQANDNLKKRILSIRNELAIMELKTDDEKSKKKLEQDLIAAQKEIESSKASAKIKAEALKAIQEKYNADIKEIDDKRKADDEAKALEQRQKSIDFENETFNMLEDARISRIQDATIKAQEEEARRYQTDIDNALAALNAKEINEIDYQKRREAIEKVHQDKLTDITKQSSQDRANAHQAEIQARGEVIDAYGTMVTGLVGVFKEAGVKTKGFQIASLIVEQAAAIAKIITSTQTANAAALATPQAIATSGAAAAPVILRNNLQAGISIATAVAAAAKGIAQIRGANANGGAAGGGGNLPSGTGGTTAPIPAQLNTTMLNQSQINQLSSATARAYVVESDVTGSQERIQRLNRAARIN